MTEVHMSDAIRLANKTLLDAIRSGEAKSPETEQIMDLPGDATNEEIIAARESGFMPRFILD